MQRYPIAKCWVMLLSLAALATAASAQPSNQRAEVLGSLNLSALQPGQQAVLAVGIDVAQGLHAQSRTPSNEFLIPFDVTLDANPHVESFQPIYPPGEDHTYPALGTLNVYTGRVIVYVPLIVKRDAPAGPITLSGRLTYQICDDRVCFPPENPKFEIATQIVPAGQPVQPEKPELFENFDATVFANLLPPAPPTQPSSDVAFAFFGWEFSVARSSYLVVFGLALLAGLIFNVMPCVLPVLPLKALGFYEASQHHRGKSLAFGMMFSLGIVAAFAGLAVLVLLFNQAWGELFSQAWFVWTLTAILVLMAASMLGLFTFRLPVGVYSFSPSHNTYSGNFLFGGLTAVLSTPCTGPLFPPLLTWAAAQAKVLGVGTIMMVGVGMALPYVVLSAFPQLARRIPRTGPWSEIVRQMMAFLLLAVAAYFIASHLMLAPNFWWPVFGVIAAAGAFLIFRTWQLLPKPRPVAIAAVISLLMVSGAFAATVRLTEKGLWTAYSPETFERSRATGQIVLIKFTANWCGNCQYVEHAVFGDDRARDELKDRHVITLKADLTRSDAVGWDLLKQLNPSGGIPLTAIYAPNTDEPIQLASIYTVANLIEALDAAQNTMLSAK